MDDSSQSSSSTDDEGHKHRQRCYNDHDNHKRKRRSKHLKDDLKELPPAQSDWEALRSHFQFVLPDEEQSSLPGAKKYGSTWQNRMVQHYHSHLYKEYVLADLSRVLEIGRVGLRWRTEDEVKSGKGFRSCGNLKCESVCNNDSSTSITEKKEAYDAAVRRSVGIGVPENNGKQPIGVVLPLSTSSEAGEALDRYLRSCMHNETTSGGDDDNSFEDRQSRKRHKKSKQKKEKKKYFRKKHSKSSSSAQHEERDEQTRLSQVPYGVGLYDYEVDFAYVEHNVNKRELVKVRLCLRCAPLLFAAKDISTASNSKQGDKIGPATKARNVRLRAMETTRNSAKNTDDNEKESVINVK
jgi:protein FRA10AC1